MCIYICVYRYVSIITDIEIDVVVNRRILRSVSKALPLWNTILRLIITRLFERAAQ